MKNKSIAKCGVECAITPVDEERHLCVGGKKKTANAINSELGRFSMLSRSFFHRHRETVI